MTHTEKLHHESLAKEASPLIAFWLLRALATEDEQVATPPSLVLNRLLALYALALSREDESSIEHGEDLPLGQIVFASTNARKLLGVERLVQVLNSIFGQARLTGILPLRVPGDEPAAEDAGAVARHKVSALLDEMERNPVRSALYQELNHRSVVLSSDVVAKIINTNGEVEHLLNLSRITDTGESVHVGEFIAELKRRYANGPFTLQYDIANAATVIQRTKSDGIEEITLSRDIQVEAVEISVSFRALPAELIQAHFAQVTSEYANGDELRAANVDPGINVGLPIFDQGSPFREYIEAVQLTSLSDQTQASWFESHRVTVSDLTSEQKSQLFDSLTVWIAYGIAPTAAMLLQ